MPFYNTPGGGRMHAAFPIESLEIEKAVLAERERCAKIVESGICDGLSWEDKALQKAADDIRKGESRYGLR